MDNIKQLVSGRKNVLIAGPVVSVATTQFGTTTVYPATGRVFTVEEVAEFRLTETEIRKIKGV